MTGRFNRDGIHPPDYFDRLTLRVARDLLGQYLVVKEGRAILAGRIVETEAYVGEDDPACHAHCGRTTRNAVMYGPPGYAYVYFTYGNHFMLNFVTEKEGFPAAVLIRAVDPVAGVGWMKNHRGVDDLNRLCRGPGNLTAAFGIDRAFNGLSVGGPKLMVCANSERRPPIETSGRVGVNDGWEKPWRFFIRGHRCVSTYRRGTKIGRRKSG